MSQPVRIAERVERPFAGSNVDRAAGVIRSVKLCGPSSQNGNDYSRASFGDLAQYEGRHAYLNHSKDRRAEDKVGWFENVTLGPDGMPRGDFHLLTSHPAAGPILEAAERNPSLFGFSHVALCKTKRGPNGRQAVEAVERVESIDLVAEPATTKSLFEGKAVTTTLREVLESAESGLTGDARKRCRKVLAEADDGLLGDVMDAPMDPVDGLAGADAIEGGIRSLSLAILDDDSLTTDEKLKKLRLVLQTGDKLSGTETKPEKSDPEPEAAEESKRLRAENDRLTRELAVERLTAGKTVTEAQKKWLARCEDDAERKELLESFAPPSQPAEKPRGSQKMTAAELLGNSSQQTTVTESKAGRVDVKAFARSVRN